MPPLLAFLKFDITRARKILTVRYVLLCTDKNHRAQRKEKLVVYYHRKISFNKIQVQTKATVDKSALHETTMSSIYQPERDRQTPKPML